MTVEFRLPDLGEGLAEAELLQWLVADGDVVALNQPLAEVETAKAVVELPSPQAGTIAGLHAAPGETVPVGAVLVTIEPEAADGDEPAADAPTAELDEQDVRAQLDGQAPSERHAQGASAPDAPAPHLVGYGAPAAAAGRPQRRARAARKAVPETTAVLEAAPHDAVRALEPDERIIERPRSTPPVRHLAHRLGIDLALVPPSGPTGLVTREDVEAYAARVRTADARAADPRSAAARSQADAHADAADDVRDAAVTRIPIRGVRKATAQAMVASAFTAPHATTFLTVDVTATTAFIARLRDDRRTAGHRIGILAVTAKAVCLALRRHPSLNSRWDEQNGQILQFRDVHLGIAAASERGLVVPNVKDAGRLALPELADALAGLADTARAGRTRPEAMTGGTFTITNVGVFGVDAGTPILNPGEAGILALGAVRREPREHDGDIVLRDVVTLSLSFDHRLVDGEQAARFLVEVGDVLRDPGRAMLLA